LVRSIRVFEYQVVKVGSTIDGLCFTQNHFQILSENRERLGHKYYTLLHQGVKFSHYVGALQVGQLTIEILPKADKNESSDSTLWHGVLLDMLRECRLLKIDTTSEARLRLRSNSVLDLYFEMFLNEVEELLRKGLCKSYRLESGNRNALKGRLLFDRHLRENYIHQQRFYTQHAAYDFDHLANRILYKALLVLQKILIKPSLTIQLHRILDHFPVVQNLSISEKEFRQIHLNRKLQSYKTALEIARLLILNYSPDIQGGPNQVLAILFDMNLLFEEYIYQQLRKWKQEKMEVRRQACRSFWNRRQIRPDIVIEYEGETVVLDTKWKILKKASPSMEDLRQVFIYCQYFDAQRSILLYPKVANIENLPPTPYHPIQNKKAKYFCQIQFLEIIKNGKLNRNIGQDLLESIPKNPTSKIT